MIHHILITATLFLCACSTRNSKKIRCGVDLTSINSIKDESSSSLTQDKIREKFGEPSFIIENENDKTDQDVISSNWYYVYYEINKNNIFNDHNISNVKISIFRFNKNNSLISHEVHNGNINPNINPYYNKILK